MSIQNYEDVAAIVRNLYGKVGTFAVLGSCQDVNYKFQENGANFVVKISNSAYSQGEIEFQNEVLSYITRIDSQCEKLDFPRIVKQNDGITEIGQVEFSGLKYFIRLLTFVKGSILSDRDYLSPHVLFLLGQQVANICLSLSLLTIDETKYAIPEYTQWDLQHAQVVISNWLPGILDSTKQMMLATTVNNAISLLEPLKPYLRKQIVHGDLAHYNLVTTKDNSGRFVVSGVIDFGDAMRSWVVGDLAVCITSGFAQDGWQSSALLQAGQVLKGFLSITKLNEQEIQALWPLIMLRSVVTIVSVERELSLEPNNIYNQKELPIDWEIYHRMSKFSPELAIATLRQISGLPPSPKYDIQHSLCSMPAASRSTTPFIQLSTHCSIDRQPSGGNDDISISRFHPDLIYRKIDLSVLSAGLIHGNWLTNKKLRKYLDQEVQRVQCLSADGPCFGIAPYGEARLPLSSLRCLTEPPTIALGVDIFVPFGTVLASPFAGHLHQVVDKSVLILSCSDFDLILRGVAPYGPATATAAASDSDPPLIEPRTVLAGEVFAIVHGAIDLEAAFPPHITVQVSYQRWAESHTGAATCCIPSHCTASMFPHWRLLCPDPLDVLSLSLYRCVEDCNDFTIDNKDDSPSPLAKRKLYVAAVQEHYFDDPPVIERGQGAYLYDTNGRAYLDVVNNVAVVGHCNRRVTESAFRQMNLLNTNSRFVYHQMGRFAEAITSKMPKGSKLEVCFFVNSGSEATDLALRIARSVVAERRRSQQGVIATHTTQQSSLTNRNIVCLEGAYHGITTASDEVSTTLNDNPRSRESRPPWVHLVPMPNPYRGPYSYPDSADMAPISAIQIDSNSCIETATERNQGVKETEMLSAAVKYAELVVSKVSDLTALGDPCVAFIAEPLSGNAGGVELPRGYLQRVYAAVRSVGGLCISDEVQVGYGRLGTGFWGFEEHGVLPDIVTMAKAAGNGHPLGFVITSREIADQFGVDGSFFSSAGGSPVSCAVGLAVLQEIEEMQLQKNAHLVGAYLRSKLLTLVNLFPETVGKIHGHGLYMGIEIIKDLASKAPGTDEAYAICRRLLELGVICHNTGDHSNVLKVKPPLVMSLEDADFFVDALIQTLRSW